MAMVEEFFGVNKKRIENIKQHVRNNIQVVIGFAFLFVGYCFQILYTLKPGTPQDSTIFTRDNLGLIIVILLGATVGLTILLRLVGYIWSKRSFKRLLTEFFRDYEWSFEENMAITKEIGELLGIAPQAGRMRQHPRGHTAIVRAGAAQPVALHQGRRCAQLAGAQGRGHSRRPTANH